MPVASADVTDSESFELQLASLPQLPQSMDFGEDINSIQETLLDIDTPEDEKRSLLWSWIGRSQPCMFGRLAANGAKHLTADLCWIHASELSDPLQVSRKIQRARRAWKDRAEQGLSSGFLIMFNHPRLAYAAPSSEFVVMSQMLSNLYLVEHAPIEPDVIYTEAVPLRRPDGQLTVFKAGCNIFNSGAHATRNHDRRIPGGLMFSMNSPGHYANSLTKCGHETFDDAIALIKKTAMTSIGNGGIGCPHTGSTSWHNHDEAEKTSIPWASRRPSHVPTAADESRYAALYHTDVLVATSVMSDERHVQAPFDGEEVWPHLILDYITDEEFPADHVNYGLFHGHPIEDCGKYHNPWPARVAHNAELFVY
jgi:hypothetical protein